MPRRSHEQPGGHKLMSLGAEGGGEHIFVLNEQAYLLKREHALQTRVRLFLHEAAQSPSFISHDNQFLCTHKHKRTYTHTHSLHTGLGFPLRTPSIYQSPLPPSSGRPPVMWMLMQPMKQVEQGSEEWVPEEGR